MAFRFRLQSVLEYKAKVEETRKLELAALLAERVAAERRLAEIDADIERTQAELSAGMRGQVDVDAITRGLTHLKWLREDRTRQIEVIAECTERIEAKRQEVVEAMQDRQALEKLRDRDAERYAEAERHAEQVTLDELATSRHGRRPDAVPAGEHGEARR